MSGVGEGEGTNGAACASLICQLDDHVHAPTGRHVGRADDPATAASDGDKVSGRARGPRDR